MKSSRLFFALLAAIVLIHAAAASAGSIDMDDPRRVVGREDDVRVDAQLLQDTVAPGSPIGVTYQIQNLSAVPVAIADRVTTASYDADSRTITVAIGAEVPDEGRMPHVVTIAPGEKKLFRTGATPALAGASIRASMAEPRYVQVKVSLLRDLAPFAQLIASQPAAPHASGAMLTDALFDQWFESNDTIFLNSVPVRYSPRAVGGRFAGAEHRDASGAEF